FVQANYRQVASFGPYAVLAQRDVPDAELRTPQARPPADTALEARYGARLRGLPEERLAALESIADERLDFLWEPVAALLDDANPRIRGAATRAFGDATESDVALPLARVLLQNAVPSSLRLMAFRRILV